MILLQYTFGNPTHLSAPEENFLPGAGVSAVFNLERVRMSHLGEVCGCALIPSNSALAFKSAV